MRIKVICKECGKEFLSWPSSDRIFCSHVCYSKNRTSNLIGKRFGRITVIDKSKSNNGARWVCRCDCGNITIVSSRNLKRKYTTSCGCYRTEQCKKAVTTHGLTGTPGYEHWRKRQRFEVDSEWTIKMSDLLFQIQTACVICGATTHLSVDHVKPVSKGYGLRPGNAIVLCTSCNSKKRAKDLSRLPREWQDKIERAASQFLSAWNSL